MLPSKPLCSFPELSVKTRKQLKENTPRVITAHFLNSKARERPQTEGEKLSLMLWGHFQVLMACGLDCPLGENSVCKPPVLCRHFRHSRSPRIRVQQMCSGSVSRVKDSCWLLQACRSASCCGEAELEKPQLPLAGSCQELRGPACSELLAGSCVLCAVA